MMVLKWALTGILIIVIYVAFSMYFINGNIGNDKNRKLQPPKQVIILVSQPRSGSTFFGRIIQKSFHSVYLYEPLYKLDELMNIDINFAKHKQRTKYDKLSKEYLENILRCDFQEKEWIRIKKSPFKQKSGNMKRCVHDNATNVWTASDGNKLNECLPFLTYFQLKRQCQEQTLVLKLLEMRIPQSDVSNLQNLIDKKSTYKIIYLARDPRASFWSILQKGWVAQEQFQSYVMHRCQVMYDNIKAISNQNNYIIVRYEDLIVKSRTALHLLDKYLPEDISQQIRTQLSQTDCYVPVSNKMLKNKLLPNMVLRKIHERTPTNNTMKKDHNIYARQVTKKQVQTMYMYNVPDSSNKQRNNYECFLINKWRYKANEKFPRLIERNCKGVMDLMGYKLINDDIRLMRDVKYSLISPYIQREI